LERQGAAERASTRKSGCTMSSHPAILPSIGILLGPIWEISVNMEILFDSNDGDAESGFILWFPQSIEAINDLPGGPHEGREVDLCMPDELRCRGKLTYDEEQGYWKAVAIAGAMRLINAPL